MVQQPGIDPALLSEEGQTDCQIQKIDHLIEVVCCAASEVLTSPFSAPTHSLRGGLELCNSFEDSGSSGQLKRLGEHAVCPHQNPGPVKRLGSNKSKDARFELSS